VDHTFRVKIIQSLHYFKELDCARDEFKYKFRVSQ
jgi:hypothetical protein